MRPAGGSAGEVAGLQAQCWREGGGVKLQQAGWVSGHRDRRHSGGIDDLPLRQGLVLVRTLRRTLRFHEWSYA